jgi:hypothetical protein
MKKGRNPVFLCFRLCHPVKIGMGKDQGLQPLSEDRVVFGYNDGLPFSGHRTHPTFFPLENTVYPPGKYSPYLIDHAF